MGTDYHNVGGAFPSALTLRWSGGRPGGRFLTIIIPLCGSILQAEACEIFRLASNPRWSRVWQKIGHKGFKKRWWYPKSTSVYTTQNIGTLDSGEEYFDRNDEYVLLLQEGGRGLFHLNKKKLLSNFRLEVDFVFPLSQEQEPPTKIYRT